MNPGLRAGTLELISSRSSLKHVTDSDESSTINCDQRASDHKGFSKIYQELNPTSNLPVALRCFYKLDVKYILKFFVDNFSLFSRS